MIDIVTAVFLAMAVPAVNPQSEVPDPQLTPGAINHALTTDKVCSGAFTTKKYRHVTKAVSEEVYREYGLGEEDFPCPCSIDHLIPLEIGGANTIKNMWPQPVREAETKDWLEDKLHRLICEGKVSLDQAQHDIAVDWIAAYHKYVRWRVGHQ